MNIEAVNSDGVPVIGPCKHECAVNFQPQGTLNTFSQLKLFLKNVCQAFQNCSPEVKAMVGHCHRVM